MAYTLDFSISLGASKTGLTLNAQIVDTAGGAVGAAVTTGFAEIGSGCYLWHTAAIPDGHRGGVKFYQSGVPGTVLAFAAINPEEAENEDAKTSTRAIPGDVTAAHATTDEKVDAAKASADAAKVSADAAARPEDVHTTVLPGTLQVRGGTFTLVGASQQMLDLPAGYASTLALRLVDADEEPVDLSEADLVLRAVDKDGEELFVLEEGDGITKTDAEDGQFTIAISAEQAVAGHHKYELGDSGAPKLYAKGDLVFRETFGLEGAE